MILLFVKEEDGKIFLCSKKDDEPFVQIPVTQEKATALAHDLLGAVLRSKRIDSLAHQIEAGIPTA